MFSPMFPERHIEAPKGGSQEPRTQILVVNAQPLLPELTLQGPANAAPPELWNLFAVAQGIPLTSCCVPNLRGRPTALALPRAPDSFRRGEGRSQGKPATWMCRQRRDRNDVYASHCPSCQPYKARPPFRPQGCSSAL